MRFEIIKNAKRNVFFGTANKIVIMLCPFIERTVIQYVLGSQYLGLNSLFNSILNVLSLSELGFSSAIVFNMYKPLAEGDTAAVNALLNFYKKAYRVTGCIILAAGLCVIPVLPRLIKGTYPDGVNLLYLYLIFLANTVISYFMFAYMSSLIVVHQRDDLNSRINTATKLGLTIFQLLVLFITKNYYLFTLLMPVFTVVNNLWMAWVVKRQFPEYHCEGSISQNKLSEIKKLVAGTFIQKACGVTRSSLDSICISAFLGLTLTAVYNNYYQILSAVTGLLAVVSAAFQGGVGNHVASKSVEENYSELKKLDFLYMLVSGWCTVCLLCIFQPFMDLWMGESMMLPMPAVVLFCLYFYVLKLGDMRYMYMTASGLFWEHKWRSIAETLANLTLNIVLGKLWGVYGIISATVISMLLCNFVWANQITFRHAFNKDMLRDYYRYQGMYAFVSLVVCALTYLMCSVIPVYGIISAIIFRLAICSVIPGLLYWIVYHKREEFLYLCSKLRQIIGN